MPPIRRYPFRYRRPRNVRQMEVNRRYRNKKRRFRYKRGNKRLPFSVGRGTQNVTKLTTLSRKEENVSISFREQLDFSNHGGQAGSSPTVIRADLMNPTVGGVGATGNDVCVAVVHNLKTGSDNPTFTRSSYNDKRNLSERLEEYFDEYRKAVVTSSEVTFNVRPKLNQVSADANFDTVSIVPYPVDIQTGLDSTNATPGFRGPSVTSRFVAANATGDLYVWCVLQQAQQQLYNTTDGVAKLSTLKQGIPGVRMTKLNVTPNSTKGCTFKMTYTPKKAFGLKDWRDNKELLAFANSDTQPTTLKSLYAYLGIGSQINGLDPADPAAVNGAKLLANCIVEVNIKYNINFSERKNIDGNNEPVPHEEL